MFWFLLCLVWLLLNGSCPSVAVVFEFIAPLNFSPLGHSCFALGPHRSVFHLSCADLVSPVSPVSLAAKGLVWLWCFWCFGVWFCVGFVCGLVVLFLLFCLFSVSFGVVLFPFAPLHALALSLTGAQRTDSSFASKKTKKYRLTTE